MGEIRKELRAISETSRLIELETTLVGCINLCKHRGILDSQGAEWDACFRCFCNSGIDVLERDFPHFRELCQQLSVQDEPSLRAKEVALRARAADLGAKEAGLRALRARGFDRMTLLLQERVHAARGSSLMHSHPQSCSPPVVLEQWLSEARTHFGMSEDDILKFVDTDCLTLPEVEELLPVPALTGTKIPDFRRISWVVDEGRVTQSQALAPALSLLQRFRACSLEEKLYDVSVLIGVSGCGKTRTMFDIAREEYALYLDFGCKDRLSPEDPPNDIESFKRSESDCENDIKVQRLINHLIAARLTAVILALEQCKKRLLTPSEILRLQLKTLSVESDKLAKRLRLSNGCEDLATPLGKYLKELVTQRLQQEGARHDGGKPTGTCFMLIDEAGVLLELLQDRFSSLRANACSSSPRGLYHAFIQQLCSWFRFPLVIAGGTMAFLRDRQNIVSRVSDSSAQVIQPYVNYPMFDANSVRSFILECIAVSDENRNDLQIVSHVLAGRPRFSGHFVLQYLSERLRTLSPVRFLSILQKIMFSQVKENRSGTVLYQLYTNIRPRTHPQLVAAIWRYSCTDDQVQLRFTETLLSSAIDCVPLTASLLPLSYVKGNVLPFAAHEPLLEDACLSWFTNSGLHPIACDFMNLASEIRSTSGKVMETILGLHFCIMRFKSASFGNREYGVLSPFPSEVEAVVPQVRAIRRVKASDCILGVSGGRSTVSFLKMFPTGWCYVLPEQRFGPDGICILPLNDPLQSGSFTKSGFYVMFLSYKASAACEPVSATEREAKMRSASVAVVNASMADYVTDFKNYVRELVSEVGELRGFVCISVCLSAGPLSRPAVCADVQWDGTMTKEYSITVHSDNCRAFLGDKLGERVLEWAAQRQN
jgi:hypothetical protein